MCPSKQTTEPKLLILVSFFSGEVTSYTDVSYCIHILWEVCRSVFYGPPDITPRFDPHHSVQTHQPRITSPRTRVKASTEYHHYIGVGLWPIKVLLMHFASRLTAIKLSFVVIQLRGRGTGVLPHIETLCFTRMTPRRRFSHSAGEIRPNSFIIASQVFHSIAMRNVRDDKYRSALPSLCSTFTVIFTCKQLASPHQGSIEETNFVVDSPFCCQKPSSKLTFPAYFHITLQMNKPKGSKYHHRSSNEQPCRQCLVPNTFKMQKIPFKMKNIYSPYFHCEVILVKVHNYFTPLCVNDIRLLRSSRNRIKTIVKLLLLKKCQSISSIYFHKFLRRSPCYRASFCLKFILLTETERKTRA